MEPGIRDETIAAISTPPGAGGIGVVRMSGERALSILKRLFVPTQKSCPFSSHRFYYGHIRNPETGRLVDEVLVVYMQAPKSYTREDVVEIHCHGSFLVLQQLLELLLACGASLAEPGEFTRRAFLNGRIDLTQAEAVIDILSARTKKGLELAQNQLEGRLSKKLEPILDTLREFKAVVEVAIDFPEDDVEIVDLTAMKHRLETEVLTPVRELLRSSEQGRLLREGVRLVIAGVPNVGKSSLMNTLLREERALVTEIPGTTRDFIEEMIDINGIPVKIIDTAGIRSSSDAVEEMGINRAKSLLEQADLVLFLVDGSRPPGKDDLELFRELRHKPVLLVVNKADLVADAEIDLSLFQAEQSWLKISALHEQGIEELRSAIFNRLVADSEQWGEEGCSPNVRHKQALLHAEQGCLRLFAACSAGQTLDLLAIDIQDVLDQLAGIVGETTTEDILDVIFERFCIGK